MTRYEVSDVAVDEVERIDPKTLCTRPDKVPTVEALHDPRPGDTFHEFYSYWIMVLDVTPNRVLWVSRGGTGREWEPHVATRDEFFTRHMYSTRCSSWLRLSERELPVQGWAEKYWPRVIDQTELPRCEATGAVEAMEADPE